MWMRPIQFDLKAVSDVSHSAYFLKSLNEKKNQHRIFFVPFSKCVLHIHGTERKNKRKTKCLLIKIKWFCCLYILCGKRDVSIDVGIDLLLDTQAMFCVNRLSLLLTRAVSFFLLSFFLFFIFQMLSSCPFSIL